MMDRGRKNSGPDRFCKPVAVFAFIRLYTLRVAVNVCSSDNRNRFSTRRVRLLLGNDSPHRLSTLQGTIPTMTAYFASPKKPVVVRIRVPAALNPPGSPGLKPA